MSFKSLTDDYFHTEFVIMTILQSLLEYIETHLKRSFLFICFCDQIG